MITDDAEAYGYTGCEPDYDDVANYDPMYAGPDDYSWREGFYDAMPYGFGIFSWERRDPRQKHVPGIARWAERYWTKLVQECPYGDDEEAKRREALFERWCVWAKKITTSNRKAA